MNKDLMKAALIGLAAGVCLSAQVVPSKTSKEIAMGRCSKPSPDGDGDDDDSCAGSCGNKQDSSCSAASSEVKVIRKSAAKKILEGE